MSQILILLALPIGVIFLFADFRQQKVNRRIAETFIAEVKANAGLSDSQKIEHIKQMFLINRFTIERADDHVLAASKKHLNLGAAIISFAIIPLYLGVLFFILWFLLIKKPDRWEIDLTDTPLSEDTPHSTPIPA